VAKRKSIAKAVPGNVFHQMGFSADRSVALEMRAELHSGIVEVIKRRDCKQAQLAEMFDTDQPRISNLIRGKIADFDLETLATYAEILGMNPRMKTARRLLDWPRHVNPSDARPLPEHVGARLTGRRILGRHIANLQGN
jgi:predicted XRE-type DNA-binding protein